MDIKKNPFIIDVSPEKCFCYLLALVWSYNIIGMYIRVLFSKVFGNDVIAYTLMTIIILFLIVKSQRYWNTKIKLKDVLFYFILIAVYLWYVFFGYGTQEYLLSKMVRVFFMYYPFYFIGVALDAEHLPWLYKVSKVSVLACILYTFTLGMKVTSLERMEQAYSLLPHICLVFYFFVKERKISDLIISLFGAVVLLFFGTRGPVLLCALFYVMCLLLFFGDTYLQKIVSVVLTLMLGTIVLVYFDAIVIGLSQIAGGLGFSTRIFDTLTADSFFVSKGRDVVTETVLQYISNSPLTGYGLAFDRLIVESYSHNLLYELCISFGVIIGGGLFVWLVIRIVRSFINYRFSNCSIILLCIIFSSGFGKLFLSSSFLIEPYFFLMLGLVTAMKTRRCRIGYDRY